LTVTTSTTGANCFGQMNGSVTLNTQGGTPNYTYVWNNSAASGAMPTGLPAGDYVATVTDMNGCTTQTTATVAQPNALTFSAATTDPTCANASTGAINLTVGGGVADYQYNWGDATTEDRINLPAGMYTVTVSYNQSGGSFLCDTVANFTLTNPTAITAQTQADSISCNGNTNGAITVNATGGTGALTYAWNTGATTSNLTGLGVGTYTLGITDANNCMITVVDSIAQPAPIAVSSDISRAGCKGPSSGAVDISPSGGSVPYTYAWSNNTSNQDLSGVAGGTYQVTLTDSKMCTFQGNYTVETSDTIFTPLFVVATGLENVDSVQVNASDSLQFKDLSFPAPTSWQWEFGNGSTSTLQNPRFSYPNNASETESSYTAKLIVGNQFCKDSLSKTIRITNNMRLNAPQEEELVYLQFTEVSAVPNPVMSYLNLTVALNREEATEVTLYDTSGKIHKREMLEGDDRYEQQIDVSNLARGMYFLRVKAEQQVHTLKIVVAGH